MHPPFLITGIGRTATKWLAACLGWDHEPSRFHGYAVSPTHLHKMAIDGWMPQFEDTRFAIITRDAEDQMLSIINRWHAVHSPSFKDVWLERLPHYLKTLDWLVEEKGAGLMDYEYLVKDQECLDAELASVGIKPSRCRFLENRELNTYPRAITKLPAWAKATAWTLQEHYEKWLTVRDTRSA